MVIGIVDWMIQNIRKEDEVILQGKINTKMEVEMDEKINSASKTIFNKKITNDILEKLLWHNKPEIYYCNL